MNDVAAKMAALALKSMPAGSDIKLRMGIVLDIDVSTGIYGIELERSGTRIVAYSVGGISATVGDPVYCLQTLNSLLVLGSATPLTGYQPLDAELTAIAALVSAADRLPYFTGLGTATLATFTAAGRALIDDANAAAQRATLGLVIGTDVQPYDADLTMCARPTGVILTDAAQTITTGVITDVTWGTEVSDPNGWTSGGSATLTVPAGAAGRYGISYRGEWSADPGTASRIAIMLNGTAVKADAALAWHVYGLYCDIACRTLAVGDTLVCNVHQNSGSNKTIVSRLEIVWLGPSS